MGRQPNQPLRKLTESEKTEMMRIAASGVERVERIRRARALLAVDEGQSFTQAARTARMRSSSGVAALVQRFHQRGMAALDTLPGAGRHRMYGDTEKRLILQEVEREIDRSPTWSLSSLQEALRNAPEGTPKVSAKTIGQVLRGAGYKWQADEHSWTRNGSANGHSAAIHAD
ncbi:MAG: helix-turn-helix domain-containing protein [Dehalococcoidia bacterium]|nr:helix-turn-helix domain-containing protein [Dehalococcoidia bacterium]